MKRVIIVTGAGRGLGRAIALRFGRAGDRVIVNYRVDRAAARAVARRIARAGGQALPWQADVRSPVAVEAMVRAVVRRWGRLDLLVNNAGVTLDRLLVRTSADQWAAVVETNLTGAFYGLQAAARVMIPKRRGHIVNVASLVGLQGRRGQAAYAASKAGLIGLTKAAAVELGPSGVQVNALIPGWLPTELGARLGGAYRAEVKKANVLGRPATVDEVAEFVYRLSTMRHVSGQVFHLDSRLSGGFP